MPVRHLDTCPPRATTGLVIHRRAVCVGGMHAPLAWRWRRSSLVTAHSIEPSVCSWKHSPLDQCPMSLGLTVSTDIVIYHCQKSAVNRKISPPASQCQSSQAGAYPAPKPLECDHMTLLMYVVQAGKMGILYFLLLLQPILVCTNRCHVRAHSYLPSKAYHMRP
jgi:hypothetical protein